MEKIYMEENKNKKGKRSVIDASVVLSFAVAIFAVFSLAMAGISVNQKSSVSYAAPTQLPDSFTFNLLGGGTGSNVVGYVSDQSTMFSVPMFVANNDASNPIFCVEQHNRDVTDGITYNSGANIEDYGLLYLLNKSYANGIKVTDATGNNSKYVEGWVTQVAIWMYLYETDPTATQASSKNYISAADLNTIKNTVILRHVNTTAGVSDVIYSGDNLYTKYVKPLVDSAKNASDVAVLNVSKASDEISKTEDGKYYLSSLITVTGDPSSALKNYTVSLEGIEGATAIGEDGEALPSTVSPGTKFYIRIPADKVTTKVQKVTVSVNAKFTTLSGKYFTATAGNLQKVVSVKADEKTISKGTEVEFVGTEDTGMSTAQTIYFIGLIVLLCGVGIVYANAKPVQVKQ